MDAFKFYISFLIFCFVKAKPNYGNFTDADSSTKVTPSGETDKVFLWTSNYQDGIHYELLDIANSKSIVSSHFDGTKPTYVFIHGFLSNGLIDWIIQAKDLLQKWGPCNVISIQWFAGSTAGSYYIVIRRPPYVGTDTAVLLTMLHKHKGLEYSDVHLIGHSLGAHVAGFVGKTLKNLVPRITGLDPAGLTYRDTKPSVRLDKTDAHYVDILHTNGCRSANAWLDCFGIDNSIGHTDFRPNGGQYQPACTKAMDTRKNLKDVDVHDHNYTALYGAVGCDHEMSHDYFVESLKFSTLTTKFLSRPCNTYGAYNNSSCGAYPQYMGFNANPTGQGEYYLRTGTLAPYALYDSKCQSRYQVFLAGYSTHTAMGSASVLAIVVFMLPLVIFIYNVMVGGIYGRFSNEGNLGEDGGIATESGDDVNESGDNMNVNGENMNESSENILER